MGRLGVEMKLPAAVGSIYHKMVTAVVRFKML